jgi:hypothetical protein
LSQVTGPRGITFHAPTDLKRELALGCGNSGLLAVYRAPGYYFEISWQSFDALSSAKEVGALATGPKRTVEIGQGYDGRFTCGAALHIEWIRPTTTVPLLTNSPGALRPRSAGHPDTVRVALPLFNADGAYRVLHFSGGCRTLQDRNVLLKIFSSVRFEPW